MLGQKPFSLQKKNVVLIVALNNTFIIIFSPTVINCTSLTVDPSGQLHIGSCDKHYGSKCNFSCTIGYRLNGSSTVACVGTGNQHPGIWNNTIPKCERKLEKFTFRQCYLCLYTEHLAVIHFGVIGFRNGISNVMPLFCSYAIVITCPALPAPTNGTRLGCPGNATMYYDTVCQFSCNNGYIGSGSQVRRCQHNGIWSGQDFTCQSTILQSKYSARAA